MKKTLFSVILCAIMTAALVITGLFDFQYKNLILSVIGVVMFAGFGLLLKLLSHKTRVREFFSMKPLRFRDIPVIFWVTIVLISGSFLLNLLTSIVLDAVGTDFSQSPATDGSTIVNIIIIALLPAFFEEFFFRGALLSTFREERGIAFSVFVSALLFTAMHGLDPYFISTFFAGVLLAITVIVTGSLYAAVIIHFINNIVSYFLSVFAERLMAVRLEGFLIYGTVFVFLIGTYFALLVLVRKCGRELKIHSVSEDKADE